MQYLEPEVGQHRSFGAGGTRDLSKLNLLSVSDLTEEHFLLYFYSQSVTMQQGGLLQKIDDGKLGF